MEKSCLLIISPGFPKDEKDTTCLTSQQIFVRTLNQVYPQSTIIILSLIYPYHTSTYSWKKNTVIPFNGKKYPKVLRPLLWLKVYNRLRRLRKENRVVGILSFWCGECALIGHHFSRRFNIAHRIWILGQDARKENRFVRWINPSPQELVALSGFLQDEFMSNHKVRPANVIANAIDINMFPNKELINREFDILGAGSLIPLKQYNLFVQVVASIKQVHPDLKVVLCGTGPEEDALRKLATELGVEKNITFAGELSHDKVLQYMLQSKILLHPSSYEGYSTVCLEALYAGCHVISFTHAEKREIPHWHVVTSENEMIEKCLTILSVSDFSPVLVNKMEDSAAAFMKLFIP